MIRLLQLFLIVLAALLPGAAVFAQAEPEQPEAEQVEAAEAAQTDADGEPAGEAEQKEPEDPLDALGRTLGPIFDITPYWAWFVLLAAILLSFVTGKLVQIMLRTAGDRLIARGWELRGVIFRDMASPANLAIITLGLQIGLIWIHTDPIQSQVSRALQLLFTLALGWFVFNLVDVVELGLRRATHAEKNKLAGQLVPLIRKALRVFVLVVFALYIAQNIFDQNITAWIAGLGIVGLAVSLAGQESIKNLFGSITVLLDKPFTVGDRIIFNGADGFVEEIGFRSTKVRTFGGHVVTVPNMKFIDGQVENVSARPFIRRTLNVTITYDTPPEKIEQAVQIIKDILGEEELAAPFDMADRAPRVYFNEFNSDSLNIIAIYWYILAAESSEGAGDGRDWWTYLDHAQKFNLRLFRAFAEAGIDFAFPTQTLYLAGDPDRQLSVRVLGSETSETADER